MDGTCARCRGESPNVRNETSSGTVSPAEMIPSSVCGVSNPLLHTTAVGRLPDARRRCISTTQSRGSSIPIRVIRLASWSASRNACWNDSSRWLPTRVGSRIGLTSATRRWPWRRRQRPAATTAGSSSSIDSGNAVSHRSASSLSPGSGDGLAAAQWMGRLLLRAQRRESWRSRSVTSCLPFRAPAFPEPAFRQRRAYSSSLPGIGTHCEQSIVQSDINSNAVFGTPYKMCLDIDTRSSARLRKRFCKRHSRSGGCVTKPTGAIGHVNIRSSDGVLRCV